MCSDILLLIAFNIINKIIFIAKIVLPLIIIIKTTISIGKEVSGFNAPNFKEIFNKFKVSIISAIMIFFVPTTIDLIFNIVDDGYSNNSFACLLTVNKSNIENAYIMEANKYVEILEKSYSISNYNNAKSAINSINDDDKRNIMLARIDRIKKENSTSITKSPSKNSSSTTVTTASSSSSFKYYKQCGEYGKINNYDTCNCGCGYVALSMIVDNINNTNYTPVGIINNLPPSSYTSGNCAIYDSTLTTNQLTSLYNIVPTVLFNRNSSASATETNNRKNILTDYLKNNYMIILLVPGHYIVLNGINNNKISVYDPANSAKTHEYTINELYNEYKNHKNRCSDKNICGFVYAVGYKKR